ncbi:MAG: hypothetical protein ACQERX_02180 [Bacillota bacterium]
MKKDNRITMRFDNKTYNLIKNTAERYDTTMTKLISKLIEFSITKAFRFDDEINKDLKHYQEEIKKIEENKKYQEELKTSRKATTQKTHGIYAIANHRKRLMRFAITHKQVCGHINFPAIKEIHKSFVENEWKTLREEDKKTAKKDFIQLENDLTKANIEDVVNKVNILSKRNLLE